MLREMYRVIQNDTDAEIAVVKRRSRAAVQYSCHQGCSPRGICLGSRRPRGSFLAGSALPRPHTVLPRSWLGLEGSALPRLGSISQLKRASAHGAQVQVQRYAQRLCLLLEMNNEEFLNVCF